MFTSTFILNFLCQEGYDSQRLPACLSVRPSVDNGPRKSSMLLIQEEQRDVCPVSYKEVGASF